MGLNSLNINNIKNQCLVVLFMLLPGLAFSAPSSSKRDLEEQRWFQVELIIFTHLNKDALESEDWPPISDLVLPEKFEELSAPEAGNGKSSISELVAYQLLSEDELQMQETRKSLARSRNFSPLMHLAWRQPTVDRDHAQAVLLYEDMATSTKKKKSDSSTDTEDGPTVPRIMGTVRVSVERYLHLDADLVYRTAVTEKHAVPLSDMDLFYDQPYPTLASRQGPAYQLEQWNAIDGFRLEESRRMRSKKIHYLDHPLFGVVALITPVELPKDQE